MRTLALALALVACTTAARADELSPAANAQFKRGVEALHAKDYAAASSAFQESYALSPKAATMCNLALTYDRWEGHAADAVEAYRKCAEDDDSGRFRDHALERARQLRAALAAMPTPPATTPPPPTVTPPPPEPQPEAKPAPPIESPPVATPPVERTPPPPPPVAAAPPTATTPPVEHATRSFFKDPAACVLTALGVAGIGVGVGLTVAGKLDDNQVATTADLGQKATLYGRAGVLEPAGYVTLGVGAALVIAGVVEWAAHGRHVAARAHAVRGGWRF